MKIDTTPSDAEALKKTLKRTHFSIQTDFQALEKTYFLQHKTIKRGSSSPSSLTRNRISEKKGRQIITKDSTISNSVINYKPIITGFVTK